MNELEVRKLEKKDLSDRVEWFNSPGIYSQMPIDMPVSLAATEQWLMRNIDNSCRKDFVLSNSEGNLAMGGLTNINYEHGRAELYIMVSPGLENRGYGSILLRWMCKYGFNVKNLERIYLFTLENNFGARRFYAKNGFQEEGVLRSHIFHEGKRKDRYIQGLIKCDWSNLDWFCPTPPPLKWEIHN